MIYRINTSQESILNRVNNPSQLIKLLEEGNFYCSSDYHLGKWMLGKDIQKYQEQDREVIKKHNALIGKDDPFLFLGDLTEEEYENSPYYNDVVKRLIKKLNGKFYMIRGNNDTAKDQFYYDCGFQAVFSGHIETDIAIYSHIPCNVTGDKMNIHGHIHGSKKYWNIQPKNHVDVYWKLWNGPIRIKDVIEKYKSGLYVGEYMQHPDDGKGDIHE